MKRILTTLPLILLFGIFASGQTGKDQKSSVIVNFAPDPHDSTSGTNQPATSLYNGSIVGSIGISANQTCDVFLLSNDDGHVMDHVSTDRQFRFLNLKLQLFDVVFRVPGFEDARVTRVAPGSTATVLLTLTPKASSAVDANTGNADVVNIAELAPKYPKKSADNYQKAVDAERKGDTSRAIELLEGIVKVSPEYYDAHNFLGILYLRSERYREAESQYNISRSLSPTAVVPLLNLATLYLQEAEATENGGPLVNGVMYDDALHVLQEATRVDPQNARAFFLLGVTFYKTNSDRIAEASFKQALAIDSRMGSARLALANLYIREKKWKDALDQFDTYLTDNPNAADREQVAATRAKVSQQR